MRLKATVVLKPGIYEFLTPPPRKLIIIGRYENIYLSSYSVFFYRTAVRQRNQEAS